MNAKRLLAICVMLTLATAIRAEFRPADAPVRTRTLRSFPTVIAGWQGADGPRLDARILEVLGADDYLTRIYHSPSRPFSLFVGYYRSQAQGDSIHSPLNCLPGAGWVPVERSTMSLTTAAPTPPLAGTSFEVNRLTIQKGEDRQLVLYWYQTSRRVIASEYWNKFFLVADAFSTRRSDAALVRLITPLDRAWSSEDTPAAADTAAFAGAVLPVVNLWLFQ